MSKRPFTPMARITLALVAFTLAHFAVLMIAGYWYVVTGNHLPLFAEVDDGIAMFAVVSIFGGVVSAGGIALTSIDGWRASDD